MTEQSKSDWIEHDGKGRPHPPRTTVFIRRRDGSEEGPGTSAFVNWVANGNDDDVVAFRLADEPLRPELRALQDQLRDSQGLPDGDRIEVDFHALLALLQYEPASPEPGLSDRAWPEIERLRPYRVFDSPSPATDGPTFFMVSTLTLPQHPVALCGPNQAFADEICDLLNGCARTSPAPVAGGDAAESARLREALIRVGRAAGCFLADEVTTDFLMLVPGEIDARLAALSQPPSSPAPEGGLALKALRCCQRYFQYQSAMTRDDAQWAFDKVNEALATRTDPAQHDCGDPGCPYHREGPSPLPPEKLAELRELLAKATPLLEQSEARCSVPHTSHGGRRVVGFKVPDSPEHFLHEPLDRLEALEKIVALVPALLALADGRSGGE